MTYEYGYTYPYNYSYGSSTGSSIMWILMIYLLVIVVWAIFALAAYILKGIGMYTMAKREGMENPWLAFVPFARTYLQGELGGSITFKEKTMKNPGIWLLALPFIGAAVCLVFYIALYAVGMGALFRSISNNYFTVGVGTITVLIVVLILFVVYAVVYQAVYMTFRVLVNHQIFGRYTSKTMSVVHGVLCVLIPLYEPICFFVMRNKPYNPGMEPVSALPKPEPPVTPYGMPEGEAEEYQTAPAQESVQSEQPQEEIVTADNTVVPARGLIEKPEDSSDDKDTDVENKSE